MPSWEMACGLHCNCICAKISHYDGNWVDTLVLRWQNDLVNPFPLKSIVHDKCVPEAYVVHSSTQIYAYTAMFLPKCHCRESIQFEFTQLRTFWRSKFSTRGSKNAAKWFNCTTHANCISIWSAICWREDIHRCSALCVPCEVLESTLWVKKTRRCNIRHNFAKCWPIFKLLSLTDSLVNLQQNLD